MNVLIVSKTRMVSDACVGAISLEDQRSLRLLTHDGGHQPHNTQFDIGEVWDIEGRFPHQDHIEPPHTEDFFVECMNYVRNHPDLTGHLQRNVRIVQGGPAALYDGALRVTQRGRAYISSSGPIPGYSTGFWQADHPLTLGYENNKAYYTYPNRLGIRSIPYVGFVDPIEIIQTNSIVRVSLARWWRPDDADNTLEPRCYLQLSGWYN